MSEAPSAVGDGPPPLAAHSPDALPEGRRLAEFEIRHVLGAGGFGIVYLAWDHQLEREVALKEYMPVTLAGRNAAGRVSIRAQSHQDTFALGLRSFVNEARLLARFDHASLVKVYRFWEDNGTAYMAMPMYHGRTLRQARQHMGPGSPGEAWCRSLLEPLLGAIECLHREGVYHRDIAPDNIVLTEAGRPVLLDFGAARRVIGDRTHALTAILKPHFAPIEQYADVSTLRQGPWTDLYGLGATFYYLLTGQPPLPAAARALHDELQPLARLRPADCGEGFLQALDWAMAVRPQERPQSVALWRDALEGRLPVPSRARLDATRPGVSALAVAPGPDFDPTQPLLSAPPGSVAASSALWRGFTVPGGVPMMQPAESQAVPAGEAPARARGEAAADPAPAPSIGRRHPWLVGALVGSALAGLAGAFAWRVPSAPPQAAASAPVVAARVEATAPAREREVPVPALQTQAAAPSVAVPPPAPSSAVPAAETKRAEAVEPAPSAAPRAQLAAPTSRTASARERRKREREAAEARQAAVVAPSVRCADRMFLTRWMCERRACETDPRLRRHPECVQMRKAEEDQRERMQQR